MLNYPLTHLIGNILPLGNLNIHQTKLARILNLQSRNDISADDLESSGYEIIEDSILLNGGDCGITQQFILQNTGQTTSTSRRVFESMLNEMGEIIQNPEVILLIYDVSNLETFRGLEFWIQKAGLLAGRNTEFILVGTLVNAEGKRVVNDDLVANGVNYIEQEISVRVNDWRGSCVHIEASIQTAITSIVVRNLISRSILRSKGFFCMEEIAFAMDDMANLPVGF